MCVSWKSKLLDPVIKQKAKIKYNLNLRVEQRLINWVGVNIYEDEEEKEEV